MDQAQDAIKDLEALKRLEKNRDFKRLITEGYFREEASRLVLMLPDPNMQEPAMQKSMQEGIIACGQFRQYLGTKYQIGNAAVRSLAADEVTRETLLAEEA